jgi:hypothetical protein
MPLHLSRGKLLANSPAFCPDRSSPSPPRSGGMGLGEVMFQGSGGETSVPSGNVFGPPLYFAAAAASVLAVTFPRMLNISSPPTKPNGTMK